MALPITVPYTFGNATTAIPLSNLDSDYATVYQAVNGIGNGSVALANVAITGGTISGNTTASNVTVSSGTFTNVTLSNVTISSVSTPITAAEGGTGSSSAFTANGVVYASSTSALATGSALTFDGSSIGWNAANIILKATSTAASALLRVQGSSGDQWQFGSGVNVAGDWGITNNTQSYNPFVISGGSNSPNFVWSGASERMRLTSAGYLGIGTSSPSYTLDVRGNIVGGTGTIQTAITYDTIGAIGTFSNHGLRIITNSLSVAVFDTSGNLLVGTTDAGASSGLGIKIRPQSGNADVSVVASGTTNANSCWNLYSTGAGAFRFYVGMGGTIYATSTTITSISDQRLKENIRDLDDGLATVMALKPRKFDWKSGKGANIKNARGFIAQEFETVFPDMIEEWRDPAPEGEEPYKAINANLIPTLVKAIQELSAKVTALEAKLGV